MKCPACQNGLLPVRIGETLLDICQHGCGGVWFDARELETVNAQAPVGVKPLAKVIRNAKVKVDPKSKRQCIRCPGVKLVRKLFSLGSGVIMDCCPKCRGVWLDYGELDAIREETHPQPRKPRQVGHTSSRRRSIPITFDLVHTVQQLQIKKRK